MRESATAVFLFEKAEIMTGTEEFETLPGSYDDGGKVEHLCVTLVDKQYERALSLAKNIK